MYGVAASMIRRGVDTDAPWLPTDAVAYADFTAGNYFASGSVQPLTTMIGGPSFDSGAIDANGMAVLFTNSNRPRIVLAMKDEIVNLLDTGVTIVFEVDVSASDSGRLIGFYDNSDPWSATFLLEGWWYGGASNGGAFITDSDQISTDDDFTHAVSGVARFGYTLGRDLGGGSYRSAWSVNGGSAITQDVAYSTASRFSSVERINLGFHVEPDEGLSDSLIIRSITVYPAVDETELSALTSLPTAGTTADSTIITADNTSITADAA